VVCQSGAAAAEPAHFFLWPAAAMRGTVAQRCRLLWDFLQRLSGLIYLSPRPANCATAANEHSENCSRTALTEDCEP